MKYTEIEKKPRPASFDFERAFIVFIFGLHLEIT